MSLNKLKDKSVLHSFNTVSQESFEISLIKPLMFIWLKIGVDIGTTSLLLGAKYVCTHKLMWSEIKF